LVSSIELELNVSLSWVTTWRKPIHITYLVPPGSNRLKQCFGAKYVGQSQRSGCLLQVSARSDVRQSSLERARRLSGRGGRSLPPLPDYPTEGGHDDRQRIARAVFKSSEEFLSKNSISPSGLNMRYNWDDQPQHYRAFRKRHHHHCRSNDAAPRSGASAPSDPEGPRSRMRQAGDGR
jgi:hypothetical protein